jgi:TetR/AcrR family transcriptional regulator, fatty acid metabolism regulator protein
MRTKSGNKERAIAEAAVKVFARDGFHGAKISRIAKEANVATGSVYLYFRNKQSILQHLFIEIWQRIHDQLLAVVSRPDSSPREKLEDFIDRILALFSKSPNLALVFVNEQHHLVREGSGEFMQYYEDFLALGEEVVREGVRTGEFRNDIDPRIISNFVFGGLRQLLQQWARSPKDFRIGAIRQVIKTMTVNGLVTLPRPDPALSD